MLVLLCRFDTSEQATAYMLSSVVLMSFGMACKTLSPLHLESCTVRKPWRHVAIRLPGRRAVAGAAAACCISACSLAGCLAICCGGSGSSWQSVTPLEKPDSQAILCAAKQQVMHHALEGLQCFVPTGSCIIVGGPAIIYAEAAAVFRSDQQVRLQVARTSSRGHTQSQTLPPSAGLPCTQALSPCCC